MENILEVTYQFPNTNPLPRPRKHPTSTRSSRAASCRSAFQARELSSMPVARTAMA